MPQWTMLLYTILHRKLTIKQHELHTKPGVSSGAPRKVTSSCCVSGTRHLTLVTNLVISPERANDVIVTTTNGTYLWLFTARDKVAAFLTIHCIGRFLSYHTVTGNKLYTVFMMEK